ncbi:hypothetical protein AA449_27500 [Salmonella enterica subsp. enterica serovar Newport]|nr:hypothetical protein [Salmonella enterica subsp. enterica serovar Infantis]ECO0902274.1 hypothetical protein [Salmonella enterica subsp. enterica serovar Newport]EGI5077993.1 hypothetical protein [Salmonella enterica subsp. enterica serovar Infantis]
MNNEHVNQYAERDAMQLDKDGGYYSRHIQAMTREGLHSKGDIAAELAWRDQQIDQLKTDLWERSKTDKAEPVAWDYEWASFFTCEGPQDFKRVIEREAPPKWAIEEGQARNIIPLYIAPPTPLVPDDIPDSVYEILYQACGDKAWVYGEALWKACRAATADTGRIRTGDQQ